MFSEETIFSFRKHSFAENERKTHVSFRKSVKKMENPTENSVGLYHAIIKYPAINCAAKVKTIPIIILRAVLRV